MLGYFLRHAELSGLTEFISPSTFKVFPVSDLVSIATQVTRNSKLTQSPIKQLFKIEDSNNPTLLAKEKGEAILFCYFYQILHSEIWHLDFRTSSWSTELDKATNRHQLKWHPRQLIYKPKPEFLIAIRSLYKSFYESSPQKFCAALKTMGLVPLSDSLYAHFGEGDQTAVKFSLKQFQKSFESIFIECKRQKLSLGQDFIALGVMLLCLYETLETLDASYNVKQAFEEANDLVF